MCERKMFTKRLHRSRLIHCECAIVTERWWLVPITLSTVTFDKISICSRGKPLQIHIKYDQCTEWKMFLFSTKAIKMIVGILVIMMGILVKNDDSMTVMMTIVMTMVMTMTMMMTGWQWCQMVLTGRWGWSTALSDTPSTPQCSVPFTTVLLLLVVVQFVPTPQCSVPSTTLLLLLVVLELCPRWSE